MNIFVDETITSKLYNIPPQGAGTSEVESLSSYIVRLSNAHCITTGSLVSSFLAPILNKDYLLKIAKRGGNGFYNSSNGINGIGTVAEDFINVIELLTSRNDLRNNTFIKWSKILPTRGLLRKTKAWCPECFEESKKKNLIIYDQLIWNLSSVEVCLKHRVKLIDQCIVCNKSNSHLSRKCVPGYCNNCKSWLGTNIQEIKNIVSFDDLVYKKAQIVNDFIVTTIKENNIYSKDRVSVSLTHYIGEIFDENISLAAKGFGFPETTFRYWVKGENQPPLESILHICIQLRININQFLLKEPYQSTEKIQNKKLESEILNKHDHRVIYEILKFIINNEIPISIKRISEIFGCDRKLLYSKYPDECTYLRKNFDVHTALQKKNRLNQKYKIIEEAFNNLVNETVYPSGRKLEERIGFPILKEKNLREKWQSLKKNIK
ncbi:hypothetical protein DZB84_13705 [Bacillus sp. HNG]|uniref:TniQ family protein n=1 Tax=Bacillus sp. HNG TaxID=2293325 RepID=UPI000E2F69E9|nr:TniQ family protein [Bacillus sp. HNG]RFB14962.1 hypothetical protein DZB84_13705 [Bacillus sp. HNG]